MIRRLTLTEGQYQALMYALNDVPQIYIDTDRDNYDTDEEYEQVRDYGCILDGLFNQIKDEQTVEEKLQSNISSIDGTVLPGESDPAVVELIYFKYRGKYDLSNAADWALEAIPDTMGEIVGDILEKEYPEVYKAYNQDGIDNDEYEAIYAAVEHAVQAMLKDEIYE